MTRVMSLQHADRQGLCAARLHRQLVDGARFTTDDALREAGYCLDAPQALPAGSHEACAGIPLTRLAFRHIP